jgi:PKD repeat protein
MSADRARGQSELVGELLLVGVVVLSVSVAGAYVLADLSEPDDEAYADIDATVENGTLAVVHRGGQALRVSDLRLRVAVNGTAAPAVTWANGTVEGDGDDRFELGERFTHPVPGATPDARVAVTLATVDADEAARTGTVLYRSTSVDRPDGTAPAVGAPAGSPPSADAGPDRAVDGEAGRSVSLDGTGTTDPDGDPVTYAWTVVDADGVAGAVDLRDADTATPTLAVTGNVTDRDHDVRVRLDASDADGTTGDTAVVTVRAVERPPTADAGPTRSVAGEDGANVTLDGTGSTDPDGDALSYDWRIVPSARDGLTADDVALVDADTATPAFRVTDNVTDRSHSVTVELTVADGTGRDDTDTTTVTVERRVDARVDATRDRVSVGQPVEFVGLAEPRANEGVVDFGERRVRAFDPGGQDGQGGSPTGFAVEDDGRTLRLTNNSWKYVDFGYEPTDRTVVRFDFRSTEQGEIHGFAFEDDGSQTGDRTFALYGTQNYGRTTAGYDGGGDLRAFEVNVGPGYPGGATNRLVFVNDDDTGARADAVSEFRDVVVYQDRPGYGFAWDFDGDGTDDATTQQPTFAYAAPGTYEVGLRVTAPDGRQRSLNRTVVVDPAPVAAATAGPTDPRVGEPVTLDAGDSRGVGLTYEWDVDGDGTYEANGSTATHRYGERGSYEATLRVTDRNGATGTATVTVVVGDPVDAVNFGGDERTVDGVTYRADRGANGDVAGGQSYSTDDEIADTTADALYRTERYTTGREFTYSRAVENGTYRVRLQFAEIFFTADDRRRFDVLAEGRVPRPALGGLDVHAEVGHDAALVYVVTVEVTDGRLDLAFRRGSANNPKASAVVVERVD